MRNNGLPSATIVSSAWMKIRLPIIWRIIERKVNGRNTPFQVLNSFVDSLCMFHQEVLCESDTMDYCVPEARQCIWHYAEIFLAVSSIFQGWKIWKLLRYLKHSMVSKSLFVNAVADILAIHRSEYRYVFKTPNSYFLKTSAMRSICRAWIRKRTISGML